MRRHFWAAHHSGTLGALGMQARDLRSRCPAPLGGAPGKAIRGRAPRPAGSHLSDRAERLAFSLKLNHTCRHLPQELFMPPDYGMAVGMAVLDVVRARNLSVGMRVPHVRFFVPHSGTRRSDC